MTSTDHNHGTLVASGSGTSPTRRPAGGCVVLRGAAGQHPRPVVDPVQLDAGHLVQPLECGVDLVHALSTAGRIGVGVAVTGWEQRNRP